MNKNANIPWIESPFFEEIFKSKQLTAGQQKLVMEYHENGFVVLPGILSSDLIDKVREECETKAFNADFKVKTQRNETRIQDFWEVSEPCRDLACHPQVLEALQLLYDRKPIPFQTLNFRVGTQQRAHSDTIHFSSLPARYMCGVWVALEDITEENGPVFYYPGSQRLPEYDFSHIRTSADNTTYANYIEYEDFIERIVAVNKLQKKKFLAKKGDLLIWSSNIIHGGSPVTKAGATRWSQVTHYFFENCYYYTPMISNMVTKELYLRRKLKDVQTGKRIEQAYNGEKLIKMNTAKKLYALSKNFKGASGVPRLLAGLFK